MIKYGAEDLFREELEVEEEDDQDLQNDADKPGGEAEKVRKHKGTKTAKRYRSTKKSYRSNIDVPIQQKGTDTTQGSTGGSENVKVAETSSTLEGCFDFVSPVASRF